MKLYALKKAIQHPDRAVEVLAYEVKRALFWDKYVASMRHPNVGGAKVVKPGDYSRICDDLAASGIDVQRFHVDLTKYQDYVNKADYARYPRYLAGGQDPRIHVRALEHYIAAHLLALKTDDIYIDVGSQESPTPDIYHRLFGATVYQQDLAFPHRIEGNTIGGDAADMPVDDGFASAMALHCSFEHFEGDSDMRFVRETERVLRPGGRICIVPLYLAPEYLVETDPIISANAGVPFESDAKLCCTPKYRNRHGRNYDVPHLVRRIEENLGTQKLTVYFIENPDAIHPSCHYIRFAAIIEKPIQRSSAP